MYEIKNFHTKIKNDPFSTVNKNIEKPKKVSYKNLKTFFLDNEFFA